MGFAVEVTHDDDPLRRLFDKLKALDGLEIEIGFVGRDGAKWHPLAKVPVAQVAAFNEFGTIDAPARPFLRSTFIEHGAEIGQAFATAYTGMLERDRDPVDATEDVAKVMARLVQKRIETAHAWAEPNKPSTIRKKGHTRPLLGGDPRRRVGPGTMLRAVGYRILRDGVKIREGKP